MKTLPEIKDEVALSYTDGKHTWNNGYLNKPIKCILMDTVAKLYAQEALKEAKKLCEELYDKSVHKLQISDLVTNIIIRTWT